MTDKQPYLPYVYVPFFPYGDTQVEWQVELQKKYPTIALYPYDTLVVSKSNESVFVLFEDEKQINQKSREHIIAYCSAYGSVHARKNVPSVKKFKALYIDALSQFKAKEKV